jgi:hypothetical protein
MLTRVGNHYSFANTYKANARLFFTQAFIPGDGEDADTGEAGAGETSAADSEAPLPKKGRGRGKKAVQGEFLIMKCLIIC